jgi:hypothetical protein
MTYYSILLLHWLLQKPGFFSGISVEMLRLSQKPGFFVMQTSNVFLVREWGDQFPSQFRSIPA